jgi:hypothetical protein
MGQDLVVDVTEPSALVSEDGTEGAAVEFQTRVPPSGELSIVCGEQRRNGTPVLPGGELWRSIV